MFTTILSFLKLVAPLITILACSNDTRNHTPGVRFILKPQHYWPRERAAGAMRLKTEGNSFANVRGNSSKFEKYTSLHFNKKKAGRVVGCGITS